MKITVVSLFPGIIESALSQGVTSQALNRGHVELSFINPRDFAKGIHQAVDDKPFGGGDGMLMTIEPLLSAIKRQPRAEKTILMSPQGQLWNQQKARDYISKLKDLTIVCGRYGGIDQRFINHYIDEEVSVGDYILSGGEYGAISILDSLFRLLPGVLGNPISVIEESFNESNLLEPPQFTRPRDTKEWPEPLGSVPEVLLSGNHRLIVSWKKNMSLLVTLIKRPDLLDDTQETYLAIRDALIWFKEQKVQDLENTGVNRLKLKKAIDELIIKESKWLKSLSL